MTTGIELVRPAGPAATAPYAYAAVTVAGQARQVMANLATALDGAGVGLGDVLKTTVYVAPTDRDDLVAAWDVVRETMGGHDAPSTLGGVTVLGYPDQLVEVEAIAIRDSLPEPAPPHDGDSEVS